MECKNIQVTQKEKIWLINAGKECLKCATFLAQVPPLERGALLLAGCDLRDQVNAAAVMAMSEIGSGLKTKVLTMSCKPRCTVIHSAAIIMRCKALRDSGEKTEQHGSVGRNVPYFQKESTIFKQL